LAAIVMSSNDAIISKSLDGVITTWNPAAEHLFGYPADEAIGQPITLIVPSDRQAELAAFMERLTRGESIAHQATVRTRKDGSRVEVSLSISPVRNAAGHIVGAAKVCRDMTEAFRIRDQVIALQRADGALHTALDGAEAALEDAEAALEDAEAALESSEAALEGAEAATQAKGDFLDHMTHELRTPLQAVLGYSEFLLMAPLGTLTGGQRADIDFIHQAGERMIALVNQMLDLSRLEAGGIALTFEPIDLPEVIEAVRQDIAPQAAARGLTVQIDVPETLPPLMGDAERVRQILLNLAGNATKFTQTGGIQITASAPVTPGVEVAVSDTGIGISPEAMLHIFEAFHQVDTTRGRRQGGSGLGLAIAWKLAQQIGGSISVSSEPGVGSTFRLHLPTGKP
jgi:PAS domain S-box-containing protein